MDMRNADQLYYKMLLIRNTEKKIEDLFSSGELRGTTHGCIGQEAVPVALSELIDVEHDYLCGGHRAHGLAIAITMKPGLLIHEIMGRESGMACGVGGSQHLIYKNFLTNGITGGMVPVAAGLAYSIKLQQRNAISVVVFGDGAMNEGYVMESFNLAGIFQLPILFVLENNGFAMSTSVSSVTSAQFKSRVEGFGLKYESIEATNYDKLYFLISECTDYVRNQRKPAFIEVFTHRFSGHSKNDKREYIPAERDLFWSENDCLKNLEKELSEEQIIRITNEVNQLIELELV